MLPFIHDGDMVTLGPVRNHPIPIGEVVAIRRPVGNNLILHRVVRKMPNGYLVQGDNAAIADGIVPVCAILARVERVEREGCSVHFGLGWLGMLIAASVKAGLMKHWIHYRGLAGGVFRGRAKPFLRAWWL